MGWRGTLRSINAAASRYDREQKRKQRELERQRKQYEKMQALEKAYFEVQEFENYIDVLNSIHKECDEEWKWEDISQIPLPEEPIKKNSFEIIASIEASSPSCSASFAARLSSDSFALIENSSSSLTGTIALALACILLL